MLVGDKLCSRAVVFWHSFGHHKMEWPVPLEEAHCLLYKLMPVSNTLCYFCAYQCVMHFSRKGSQKKRVEEKMVGKKTCGSTTRRRTESDLAYLEHDVTSATTDRRCGHARATYFFPLLVNQAWRVRGVGRGRQAWGISFMTSRPICRRLALIRDKVAMAVYFSTCQKSDTDRTVVTRDLGVNWIMITLF